jgi:hypothetical protein
MQACRGRVDQQKISEFSREAIGLGAQHPEHLQETTCVCVSAQSEHSV